MFFNAVDIKIRGGQVIKAIKKNKRPFNKKSVNNTTYYFLNSFDNKLSIVFL